MKRILRMLMTFVVLGSILGLNLSCSNETSVEADSKIESVDSEGEGDDRLASLSCGGDTQDKIDSLNTYLSGDIGNGRNANELERQRGLGYFSFEPVAFAVPGYPNKTAVLLKVKGGVLGHMDNTPGKSPILKRLFDFLDKTVTKGCVARISFESGGSLPQTLTRDGFEWQACPAPTIPCLGGYCSSATGQCLNKKNDPSPTPSPTP